MERVKWEQSCFGVGTDSQRRIQVQKLCVLCENSNFVLTRCAPGRARGGDPGTPQDCGGCTRGSTWLSATGPCAISRSLHWSTMRLPRRQRQQISHKLSTWRHAQTVRTPNQPASLWVIELKRGSIFHFATRRGGDWQTDTHVLSLSAAKSNYFM